MTETLHLPLLERIQFPSDLRTLPEGDLPQLCRELREFLIRSVSKSTGHFAAGLGAVEVTVALHYVYNTPEDRLVWDVGHQSYPHKILTGRRDDMHSVRQWRGLSPFPKRSESDYDTSGVGHAGTSIGAAQGMAEGIKRTGSNRRAVAIIGDGAMTSGMAFEALNHAGACKSDLLVILNDNEMSISPNVGALSGYLTRVLSGRVYSSMRESGKRVLGHVPPMKKMARRAEERVKGLLVPGTLFEELGFHYYGPVDGHGIHALVATLRNLRDLKGPRLLHIATRKGKGYAPAEADPVKYHGISAPFDPAKGIAPTPSNAGDASPTYSQVFGDWLCDAAAQDARVVGITPAMREGSGMVRFQKEYPDRYFDVAIAEQHSVTLAAGLACEGMKPVVAIYSTFLQRAYDQAVHDVAIQNLPVVFAIDRAGVVGGDGPTHAGSFDIGFLRCLPNMVVMTPADENETRQMLYTALQLEQPSAVRYPRGKGPGVAIEAHMQAIPVGTAERRRVGRSGIAILAFGPMLEPALEAADELDATVVNMRFVKPMDEAVVLDICRTHELVVTVDENAVAGGAGSAVNEIVSANGLAANLLNHGLPDRYIQHGSRGEMLRDAGLTTEGLLDVIRERLRQHNQQSRAADGA
ncbi:MAG: 1-deoxy-D-xylulose-5-phosphate synthase [Pseudomonadota bacterium]